MAKTKKKRKAKKRIDPAKIWQKPGFNQNNRSPFSAGQMKKGSGFGKTVFVRKNLP